MKHNFIETIKQKTDKELEIISKDCAFYSEEERLVALNELEARNSLTKDFLNYKNNLEIGWVITNNEILAKIASKGKRFVNFLLDTMIFIPIFSLVWLFLLEILLYIVSPELYTNFIDFFKKGNLQKSLLQAASWIVYYSFFEGLVGRTLAKYITKTKVVNEKGEKPDFKTILIRSLCRLFPFEQFSFLGSDRTGWHDEWSKTIVIKI